MAPPAAVMAPAGSPCYDRPMKVFVCEIDTQGLRRVLPDGILPAGELSRLARDSARRLTVLVWTLLEEAGAESLRAEIGSGRIGDTCGLLFNRAVELLSITAAVPPRADQDDRPD